MPTRTASSPPRNTRPTRPRPPVKPTTLASSKTRGTLRVCVQGGLRAALFFGFSPIRGVGDQIDRAGSGGTPCPVGRGPLLPPPDILSSIGSAPPMARWCQPPAATTRLPLSSPPPLLFTTPRSGPSHLA